MARKIKRVIASKKNGKLGGRCPVSLLCGICKFLNSEAINTLLPVFHRFSDNIY